MDLFLIRHGQSQADLLKVHEGRADFPLTDLGRQQAAAMAAWMAGQHTIGHIYASPLKRAAETASLLASSCGLNPVWKEDLMEHDNGRLAGVPYAQAEVLYPKQENLPVHRAPYDMEPALDFRCRAERVLSEILEESREMAAIALVSHGGMINQLFHCLLRLPLQSGISFPTGDTAIHAWRLTETGRTLLFANRQEHLKKII